MSILNSSKLYISQSNTEKYNRKKCSISWYYLETNIDFQTRGLYPFGMW